MPPDDLIEAVATCADQTARAQKRADEHRKRRDDAVRAAVAAGHGISLISRATKLSRTAVRKIARPDRRDSE